MIVLASTSPYRRELLARLGFAFECVAPQVDECQFAEESVASMVARLAEAKAADVASRYPGAVVIGSDQAASLGECRLESDGLLRGPALGKPQTRDRAIEQLLNCSGRDVSFYTAVCLIAANGVCRTAIDVTTVAFRPFDAHTAARYVDRESPVDCAGSFKSEGLGISLCDRIESNDPTALVGLPLIALCGLLRGVGFVMP